MSWVDDDDMRELLRSKAQKARVDIYDGRSRARNVIELGICWTYRFGSCNRPPPSAAAASRSPFESRMTPEGYPPFGGREKVCSTTSPARAGLITMTAIAPTSHKRTLRAIISHSFDCTGLHSWRSLTQWRRRGNVHLKASRPTPYSESFSARRRRRGAAPYPSTHGATPDRRS